MKKSEFLVLEGDDVAERIKGNSKKLEMFISNSNIWNEHVRGEKIGKLVDTGNDIKINIEGQKIKLDYSQFCYLYSLTHIKMLEDKSMSSTTEIVKKY